MINVILASLGTAGDVFPFIQIGAALTRKGHRVTLITSPKFQTETEKAGLRLSPVGTVAEFDQAVAEGNTGSLRKQLSVSRRMVQHGLSTVYDRIRATTEPGLTVVAANTWSLGARVAQEQLGLPFVTVHNVPAAMRSWHDTPVYYRGFDRLYRLGRPMKRLLFALMDRFFFERFLTPQVNAFRATLGLAPMSWVRDPNWIQSTQRVIGLWPEWFAACQPDWPMQTVLSGFTFYDHDTPIKESDLEKYVGSKGQRVAVFSPASWITRTQATLDGMRRAGQKLGLRFVVLGLGAPGDRRVDDPWLCEAGYVPLRQILPRSAVVIHSGGVGTTAHALAAGVPQVIAPEAGDHFDNCFRAVRLGVAVKTSRTSLLAEKLVGAVQQAIGSPIIAGQCKRWQEQVRPAESLERACALIQESARDWRPANSSSGHAP